MNNSSSKSHEPKLVKTDLGGKEFANPKILIVQTVLHQSDFSEEKGLTSDAAKARIQHIIEFTEKHPVNLIVMPELSVPPDCIETIKKWTKTNLDTLFVAGSHYKTIKVMQKRSQHIISVSNIRIAGNIQG